MSSTAQKVVAHYGKAVSRVIAPLLVSGGALSEDEFRSEVVASQPSEASSPGAESWLHENALRSFLAEVEAEHLDGLTDCAGEPRLAEPMFDPARLDWGEVSVVTHYSMSVVSLTDKRNNK